MILFLRKEDTMLLKSYKKMIYENIKDDKIIFSYHILGEDKS